MLSVMSVPVRIANYKTRTSCSAVSTISRLGCRPSFAFALSWISWLKRVMAHVSRPRSSGLMMPLWQQLGRQLACPCINLLAAMPAALLCQPVSSGADYAEYLLWLLRPLQAHSAGLHPC